LQWVLVKRLVVSKMQNVIHSFLFDFLTLRASRVRGIPIPAPLGSEFYSGFFMEPEGRFMLIMVF